MKLNEKQIAALEENGFRRWTKGTMDRLCINAETLGLEIERRKSGSVSSAYYRGERISNNLGSAMAYAKTYIDVATGELISGNWTLEQDAQQLYDETMEALDASEVAETESATEQATDAETTEPTTDTEKEDQNMSNNTKYEIKEKIVKAGNSRVFNSWHESAGITEEAFLDGLRWLCEDPMPDGRLTRELGCIRKAGSGMTPEQIEQFGIPEQREGVAGLYRLTRSYDKNGKFLGFYDEDGRIWGGVADCASLSARDRV